MLVTLVADSCSSMQVLNSKQVDRAHIESFGNLVRTNMHFKSSSFTS